MRIRALLLAVCMAGAIVVVSGGQAQASGPRQPFAAQAAAAHLSSAQVAALQSKVDGYLSELGGRQVALNVVAFAGGQVRVALPGEAHPRNFGSPANSQLLVDHCATAYSGYFCAYSGTWFTGDESQWWQCGPHNTMPYGSVGSFKNAQTYGTVAHFENEFRQTIGTSGPAYSQNVSYNWGPVWYVWIC